MDVHEATDGLQLMGLVVDVAQKFLNAVHCRMQLGVGLQESSVQVVSRKRGSVVADNYAVGVAHGNNFEHSSSAQINCFQTFPRDEIKEALHNKRC